jgi:Sulfatase-modifying factor enzyme 1/Caspase domain
MKSIQELFRCCAFSLIAPGILFYFLGSTAGTEAQPPLASLFVTLGNLNYQDEGWPPLKTPEQDAAKIRQVLNLRFGFVEAPRALRDFQSKQQLIDFLHDLQSRAPFDSLVFYFAGHGTVTDSQAYLVPLGAKAASPASDLLSVKQLLDELDAVPANHIVVVLDACRSGLEIRTGQAHDKGAAPTMRSRVLITSAMGNQTASDSGADGSSLFTGYLLHGLESSECDLNLDGICTSTELALYLEREVLKASSGDQVPVYERFGKDDGGDLTFRLNSDEVNLWQTVSKSPSREGFQGFLRKFPTGAYSDQAKRALRKLELKLLENGNLDTDDVAAFAGMRPNLEIINLKGGLRYVWVPKNADRPGEAVGDFWIGQTEVPVKSFQDFQPAIRARAPGFNPNWKFPDQPMVNLSWDDANQFCAWSGGKLPSEVQWSYAACGGQKGPFPWGGSLNDRSYDIPLANVAGGKDIFMYAARVGTFPKMFGLYDMIGNAAEWTATVRPGGKRTAMGGSFASPLAQSTCSRPWILDSRGDNRVGFRCVIEPRQSDNAGLPASQLK